MERVVGEDRFGFRKNERNHFTPENVVRKTSAWREEIFTLHIFVLNTYLVMLIRANCFGFQQNMAQTHEWENNSKLARILDSCKERKEKFEKRVRRELVLSMIVIARRDDTRRLKWRRYVEPKQEELVAHISVNAESWEYLQDLIGNCH